MEMDEMHRLINDAIRERRRLAFVYAGKLRRVEPQCYGIGRQRTRLLRAHQLSEGSNAEPLFDLAKASAFAVLDETFTAPGPNYKRNDSAMVEIFAQL